MAITQKQLADRLGVSQMTVSSALRGSDLVAPQTRHRILEAARQMGYRLNTSARAMRDGRTGCVAVLESVAQNRSSFFGGALFDGIHDTLATRDIHLTVSKLPDEKLVDETFIPKILREYTADGLLINYFAMIPPRLIELIDRFAVPAVWINSKQKHNAVLLDDYAGGRAATEYLLELGHRRIAYADAENNRPKDPDQAEAHHYSIIDRHLGYEQAMRDAGLKAASFHDGPPLPHDKLLAAFKAWLDNPDRPTAVVAYSERSAEVLIVAAAALGLRIPEDLSLICFTDRPALNVGLTVTAFRHRWSLVGKTAADMIMLRVEQPGRPIPCRMLPFEFIPGQTDGPPPSDS